MADRVIQRNDTAARWQSINPVLATGELGIVTDGAKGYKIGDGVTPWNDLPYPANPTNVVQELGNDENAVISQKGVADKLSELDLRLTSSQGFLKDKYNWVFVSSYTLLKGFYRPNGEFVSSNHTIIEMPVTYGQLLYIKYNITNYSKNISLLSYWYDDKIVATPLSTNMYTDYNGEFIVSIPVGVNKVTVFGDVKVVAENKTDLSLRKLNLLNDFTTFTSNNIALEKDYEWIAPDPDTIETLQGYYKPNGEFVSSKHTTMLIEVTPLQLVKLDINYSNYSNAALITLWNNETFMGSPLTSDLYPEYKGTVIVTIPKNVNKIGIISNNVITAFVPAIKAEESNNTDILVNSLQVQSGNLILTSEVHKELGIDNLGKIQFPSQGGWNLCVVKVKPNTTYYIRANDYRENAVGALGYSDTKDITPDKTISEVDMDSLPSYNGYKVFTTDDTTEYLYINLTPLLKDNNVVIKENIEDLELPTTIGEREILKQLNSIDKISPFNDKKIALLGDSITWQAISSTPNRGWATYFNKILQFGEFVNYARSGATWSNTVSTTYNITENTGSLSDDNVIYNQFNRLLNDILNGAKAPDYIIIAAGTNDAWYPNSRPNALSKTAKEVFEDESTDYLESVNINQCTSIAQAFRYVAEMIIANLPTTKVVICTPLQSTAFTADRNKSITEVISSCANYMSWNVIVQSEECGINRLEEKRGYKNTYDGTHTSETGAKMIGAYLANKFNSLFGMDFLL